MRGELIEAQRMANNVVGPWEVDSSLTGWFGLGGTVLKGADALALIGPEQVAAAAGRHNFINGFASSRVAEGQKILLNAVLRFADPASAIDQFRATDPPEFADVSIDTNGLLARTLPVEEQTTTVVQIATYERRGALQFQSDPARSAVLFSETGMDLVAMAGTNVYQTEDSQGAARIVDGFFAELQPTSQPADAIKNLPDSRCLKLKDKTFYCLAAADRYAIEATSENLLDAHQQTAAQYAMLMSG